MPQILIVHNGPKSVKDRREQQQQQVEHTTNSFLPSWIFGGAGDTTGGGRGSKSPPNKSKSKKANIISTNRSSPRTRLRTTTGGVKRKRRLECIVVVSICVVALISFWMGSILHVIEVDVHYYDLLHLQPQLHTTSLHVPPPPLPSSSLQHHNNNNAVDRRKFLWRDKENIPDWMKEYMDWHHDVVTYKLTNSTKRDYNYLILRCLRYDERCGGVSDRLKPLPLILLGAARSKRILFIRWDKPCPLERFLVPPSDDENVGLEWIMPPYLLHDYITTVQKAIVRASRVLPGVQSDSWMQSVHLHDAQGGSTQYDEEYGKDAFLRVYHDMWRVMFRPSPPLQEILNNVKVTGPKNLDGSPINDYTNKQHPLQPDTYSVAHFRAEYGKEVERHPLLSDPNFLRQVAINSLRCATELQPNTPIFFASDNMVALQYVRSYADEVQYPIYTFDREETIVLRLDQYEENVTAEDTDPAVYFSTFVDLYLTGNGHCVTHGRGGFGRFANMLSFNSSCVSKHVSQFFPVPCAGTGKLFKTKKELRMEGFKNP